MFRQKVWCILNSKLGFYSHIRCVINSGAVCNTQLTSPATTFCHIPRGGWGKTPPRHLSVHLHAQGGIGNPPPRKGKREKKGDELFLTIKGFFLSKPFPPPPPIEYVVTPLYLSHLYPPRPLESPTPHPPPPEP